MPAWNRPAALAPGLDDSRREQTAELGVWMFLATVTMLFAAFTSAYIVRRSGSDWRPLALPSLLWLNTLVLATSSVVLEVGRRHARGGRWQAARRAILATAACGLLFLGGQLQAWRALVAESAYLPTSPYSAFFYILTGFHGGHLVAGALVLLYAAYAVGRDPDRSRRRRLAGLASTFWHFFGLLWLYLFLLLSFF
jgi:cytochrome c oxidase subunit 3